MVRAFVAIGSNIDPEGNIRKAIRALASEVRIIGMSTVYLTEPEGRPGQPRFYNLVIEIETSTPPRELKYQVLRGIESGLNRKRTDDKYAPRTIDLDLILYGDVLEQSEDLSLPDPQILERPFLAIPLAELSPNLVLPGIGLDIRQVIGSLRPNGMKVMKDFTELLRKEIGNGSESRKD